MSYHEPIRPLFESALVRIGNFRCPVDHPLFYCTGPTRSHLMVFPRTGVWIEQEGRPPFVADATHAVLYDAQHAYTRRPISPEGDRCDFFGISASLHREVQAAFDPSTADAAESRFRQPQAGVDASTYRLQRRIVDYVGTQADADAMAVEEAVIEILQRLLTAVYQQRPLARAAMRHRDLAEDARAYLAGHFASKQSLTEVARALDCSVFHLCRVFRRHTGMTLHEYRQQLRVRHALETVTSGTVDLLDVALGLGYSGHSHFTAAFRHAFGAPPSVVRAEPPSLDASRTSVQ